MLFLKKAVAKKNDLITFWKIYIFNIVETEENFVSNTQK